MPNTAHDTQKETRDARLTLRLTPENKRRFAAACEQSGLLPSAVLHSLVIQYLQRIEQLEHTSE